MVVLTGLQLSQFRKLAAWAEQLEPLTVLIGPNGSGKTSILEAVHFLSTGRSFRAGKTAEVVAFDHEYGRVKGMVDQLGEKTELELMLTRGVVQGKRTRSVLYSVNGVRKRQKDFVGQLLSVAFRPEDMRLIEGSPGRRRGFLDGPLSLLHPQYAASLKTYSNALVKRNKLLVKIREGEMPRTVLSYFTQQVLKHGQIIQEYRKKLAGFADGVVYQLPLKIEYQPSIMSEERMEQYSGKELAAGYTLIGPHKDDFSVTMPIAGEHRDLGAYGSRGQQRMAVLWLKLVEWQYLAERSGQNPLLLLDDIFSELDAEHSEVVMHLMKESQTILTSADSDFEEKVAQLEKKVLRL